MGDTTRNLSRREFACACECGLSDPHPELVVGIQRVVDMTPGCRGVIITSGTRCPQHQVDLRVRGISKATGSMHLVKHERGGYSLAADCIFLGCSLTDALVEVHKTPAFALGGIGLYVGRVNRVHVDVRKGRARWGVLHGKTTMYDEARAALVQMEG